MKILVWDSALRLFHWLLAGIVIMTVITGKLGGTYLFWHADLGSLICSLLVFRILWGFFGTRYALFKQFFPYRARLRAFFSSRESEFGHNTVSGVAVLIILSLLMLQSVTGLLSHNEELDFAAAFSSLVSSDLGEQISGWHLLLSDYVIVILLLHISAVLYYLVIKKKNLISPMISGYQRVSNQTVLCNKIRINRLKLFMSLMVSVLIFCFIYINSNS